MITEKKTPYKARTRTIGRISKEIASLSSHYKLGLVHGGGSFGHAAVQEVIDEHGSLDYRGFHKVTHAMNRLNELVLSKLIEAGVPAVSVPPHSICKYDCKSKRHVCEMETISLASGKGLVPLLFGDLIISDGDCPPQVLSGDRIVYMLASILNATRVVFVIREPGVYVNEDGRRLLIRRVSLSRIDHVIEKARGALQESYTDVTMGMIGKLLAIKEGMEKTSVKETIILPGEPPNILIDYLLRGKRDLGTLIFK